ncbi:MAG: hypothetical protein IPL61_32960 [Myxococcales bacterium]|nr:hypothetical protein [Myxococcales bacterium]
MPTRPVMGHLRNVGVVAMVVVGLGSAWARADEPPGQKARRDKALAALDKEVGKLGPQVTNVDKKTPCPTAVGTTPKPAAAPARRHGRGAIKALGGAPFCASVFTPDMLAKLQSLRDEVSANNGPDARAGWVTSKWGDYFGSYAARLKDLEAMKTLHRQPVAVGQQCKDVTTAVLGKGKAALAHKSLDEFDAARLFATQQQPLVREWVSTQEANGASMIQLERNTRLLETPSPYDKAWAPVVKAMYASSKKMLDQWQADWATAAKACAEPTKGEDHAQLKQLEDQLYAALKQQLDDDLAAWRAQAKSLYQYDCESMKELHEDYCDNRDGDGELIDEEDVIYGARADELKVEMNNRVAAAIAQLDDFHARAGVAQARRNGRMVSSDAYNAWRDQLNVFADQVVVERNLIDDVVSKGIARGSRNPKIQMWINFGKQQHRRMEDVHACRLADREYCARWKGTMCELRYRPDCVTVTATGCKIWEFKPPGARAKAKGQEQLTGSAKRRGYKDILDAYYNLKLTQQRDGAPVGDVIDTVSILDELETRCAKGGTLTFDTEVAQYEKCGADVDYVCAPQAK